jgi:hypothetical protein
MNLFTSVDITLADIHVAPNRRPRAIRHDLVAGLAESVEKRGLLQPITAGRAVIADSRYRPRSFRGEHCYWQDAVTGAGASRDAWAPSANSKGAQN